ncbi:MAG: hypothetical protein IKS03_02200 [Ruminococcus sp.]|nr:hypothetical protein [Ruminococcus sp.]
MNQNKLIIGVIVTRTADTEQRELLQEIIPAAWEKNADVVVISNIYNPEYDDEKLAAENDIYRLIESPDLCGLILVTESFINPTHRRQITQLMNTRNDIPQIAVGSDVAGFHLDHEKRYKIPYGMSESFRISGHADRTFESKRIFARVAFADT